MAAQTVLLGSAIANESTTITTSQQAEIGSAGSGIYGAGAASGVVNASNNAGNITLTQESPGALMALQAGTAKALDSATTLAMGSLGIAKGIAEEAGQTLKNVSESPLQSFGKILLPLGIAIAVIAGIYFYRKG